LQQTSTIVRNDC